MSESRWRDYRRRRASTGPAEMLKIGGIVDRADQRAANVIPIMRQIQRSGATSLRQIAETLNARGINAPRGGQWHATSVRNVMARA
jgi:hypothetical protein